MSIRDSENVKNLINNELVDLAKNRILEKHIIKSLKIKFINTLADRLEKSLEDDSLSFLEILKGYEVIERADIDSDGILLKNFVAPALEAGNVIQTNVGSSVPTLVGNVNNVSLPDNGDSSLNTLEYKAAKSLIDKIRKATTEKPIDATIVEEK